MKRVNFRKGRILLALVAGFLIINSLSCKKFLGVQPRNYMFEEEAFSTPKGVESVLNGIYLSLSDSLLYGRLLTLDVTERMAQYYALPSSGATSTIPLREMPLFASIWKQGYQAILGVNNFCSKLEDSSFRVLAPEERNILLGEGYALRAFLHFDQLRLFGPIFSKTPEAIAIPYIRKATASVQPLLPASAVVKEILQDLDTALSLLKNDPVRTKGAEIIAASADGTIDYLTNRHLRMNYFAVKTLAARVLLYAGRNSEAWEAANSILLDQEPFFPWLTEQEIASDPLLSKESFFGIENRKLYDYYRQMFSPLLQTAMILTPAAAKLDGIYNPLSTDLRLRYWFKIGSEGNKNYKVFIKHSNATITDPALMYYQPLIRKSELYLIAAETAPDPKQGYGYLNSLRVNKGLTPIAYQANTQADLLKAIREEYEREFIGEGQTFFMFKRLNVLSIPAPGGVGSVSQTEAQYIPALPQDENYYR